jgi:acyl-CoA dehydrogenase family protein 9
MIQRKFAVAAAECYAADAAWMLTASMVDKGGIDFALETAAGKVFASELAFRSSVDAMQVAGGIGYSKEFPYEQAVRDSRINMIFEGTNEILRALIALSGLQQPGEHLKEIGKAFRDPLHSIGAIGSFLAGRVKRQIVKPVFAHADPALKEEGEMIGTVVHDLALAVEKQLIAHGKEVIEHQFQQERMANVAIDVYVATATLSRTTWAIAKAGGAEKAEADLDNARIFIPMAMRRARRNVRAMERNQDARLKSLAQRALDSGSLTVAAPTDA